MKEHTNARDRLIEVLREFAYLFIDDRTYDEILADAILKEFVSKDEIKRSQNE